MKTISTKAVVFASPEIEAVGKAFEEVAASFERFCLAAGIEALSAMMTKDAEEACGSRHCRSTSRHAYRWGRTNGKLGFHGGKINVERPRVRAPGGTRFTRMTAAKERSCHAKIPVRNRNAIILAQISRIEDHPHLVQLTTQQLHRES